MKKILLLTLVLAALLLPAMQRSAEAQIDEDTLWTRDFWRLGYKIVQVQFTPDGEHIAIAIGKGVYILDKNTGEIVKQFTGFMTSCNSFVIFEDKNWLVTTSDGNKVIIWDYQTTDTIRMYNICLYSIKKYDDHSIVGMGNLINGWHDDSTRIDVFDLNTGEIVKRQWPENSHLKFVYLTLEISNEKNLLAAQVGPNGNQVALYDLKTLEPVARLQPGLKLQNDMAFSPDGKYIASAGSDGIVHVWDVDSKQLVSTLTHFPMEYGYLQVEFSPNGGYLVSSGGILYDFTTKIWDYKESKIVYEYPPILGAQYALNISKDSLYIAISGASILFLLNSHWGPTKVNELPIETAKVLYPNPSGNNIKIPINEKILPQKVIIYSLQGNKVKEINRFNFSDGDIEIDINSLKQGSYFVNVIYQNDTQSYKFEKIN